MKFTGEQFIPGIEKPRLADEHLARYNFALQFVTNKVVLDAACGVGYGASLLATKAKSVQGVDLSSEAIEYARGNYKKENLTFHCENIVNLPLDDRSIDVVISFETIEHLNERDREKFYNEIKRVLKNDGLIIFSTPNINITSPFRKKPLNEFHAIEFTDKQLRDELGKYFKIKNILGQRIVKKFFLIYFVRRAIFLIHRLFKINTHIYDLANGPEVIKYDFKRQEPRIFIVICKKYV